MYLRKYDLRGSVLGRRLCWIHSRRIWDNASDLLRCPEYITLRDHFLISCGEAKVPFHNAVAFWDFLLEHWKELSDWELYWTILCASCNYGDYFKYSITREIPADLAWPEDLTVLRQEPSEEMVRECREQIRREIQNNPDLVTGVKNFYQFRAVWNTHLSAAKKYRKWKVRYDKLEITDDESKCSTEEVMLLANIFHQYIFMLSERANSRTHDKFEECYTELLSGQQNSLFYSLQCIASLLHKYKELTEIAPVYVLGIFQKDTSKLYGDWIFSDHSRKIKIDAFSNAKPKLNKNPSNNTAATRNAQLITYQLLCKFFKDRSSAEIAYDQDLCDYIIQICIPLIELKYFDLDTKKYQAIVHSGQCFSRKDFCQKDSWVHPLLEKISERLSYSLNLYPESIPKLSFTRRKCKAEAEWRRDAQRIVDDDFVDEYIRILLISDNGLGCPRIPGYIWETLADLMDRGIARSKNPHIKKQLQQVESVEPEILRAYEKGFHEACADKVYNEYRSKILLFLYGYFQSDAFCYGKRIPDSEEFRKAEVSLIPVWSDKETPDPPSVICLPPA